MIRTAVLCALSLTLTSCATPSRPGPSVEQPKPLAVDPRICAKVLATPKLPRDANIVQPVTVEERTATALFLAWVADLVDVATENEARAGLARKAVC